MKRSDLFREIATIEAVSVNTDYVDALLKEAESLDKRAQSRIGKQTKTQKENVAIKASIVSALSEAETMTATEVSNAVGISLAQATALLTQMVKGGEVNRSVEKKVAHFSVA